MITLRADLAAPEVAAAVAEATGAQAPGRRRIAVSPRGAAAWMAPDELMLFTARDAVAGALAKLEAALSGTHHLAADVSDARAVFRLEGFGAREILAKGAPVDLAPGAFGLEDFRRTRLGQVAAALWSPEPEIFQVMCFRSVAEYVALWLEGAARPGASVGFFRPSAGPRH
jgi:sarcosine oxidase subunit gamma